MRRGGYGRVVIGGVVTAIALSGCQIGDSGTDVVNGKAQFVEHCSVCHVLARAGATGVTGPNLDEAFKQSKKDGLGESTIAGVVHQQILWPNRNPQFPPGVPQPGVKAGAIMPAQLVTGDDARDVGAYVAMVAGEPGEDEGRLAAVGATKAEGTAVAENGTLEIPVAATGLAYQYADAESPAGEVTIKSPNPQPVEHDIAIEGNGVNEKGEIVTDGGVSEFTATLPAGEYTFFCSVEGHRQGGMEGKLTVK